MGYAAAGFTTFMTILGRYDLRNTKIDEAAQCLSSLHRQSNIKHILKTSIFILITAETACM